MTVQVSVARLAVHLVSGLSVTKVVGDVVKNNTTIVTPLDQLRVLVGGFVLSSMAVDVTSQHVEKQLDIISRWFKKTDEEEHSVKVVEE